MQEWKVSSVQNNTPHFFTVLIGMVLGVIGFLLGVLIGGNFAQQFVFNGVRGYEATGQLGFILAVLIDLFSGMGHLTV